MPKPSSTARQGFVVPAADPPALAAALLKLAGSPALRQSLGEAGRKRLVAHFTLEACVAQYRALYDELLVSPQTANARR